MVDTIAGVICIVMGSLAVIFHKKLAQTEVYKKVFQLFILLCGVLFAIVGFLTILAPFPEGMPKIISILFIIGGLALALFHKKLAHRRVETEISWGLHRGKLAQASQIGYLLAGISFIIFGLLLIFHKLK